MKSRLSLILALCLVCMPGKAQSRIVDEFQPVCDSLAVLAKERFGNKGERLKLWKAVKRGGKYDLYFSRELADWPWKEADQKWFRTKLNELYPARYKAYKGGAIFCRNTPFEDLLTPLAGNSGKAPGYKYAPRKNEPAYMVRQQGARQWKRGLSGRNIALWQSHGRYYNEKEDQWMWQRAPIHRTIEDLYTQSYVLPFLIPMLENAGAYVMTPRERDTNPYEIICDNDPAFGRDTVSADFSGLPLRAAGKYSETGKWSDAGEGFADIKAIYTRGDNPFRMGSSRTARCTPSVKASATAVWSADVPARGEYAVYVSYRSTPNSSRNAVYTVNHLGGKSHFCVNQRMGGGGWIYLGSFEFAPGKGAQVVLDNSTPQGYSYEKNSVVSADAVKIGGGIGKIARGRDSVDVKNWTCSGLPAYLEGAMYWMQWAGIDYDTVINQWDRDYTRDYASRGAWVNEMKDNRGVPFDLSLALHSDAGLSPDDSIVGTLAIYSLLSNGSRKFSDGRDRMAGRLLADYVQTQVTDDLRAEFDSEWSRRDIRDRSYSESRSPDLPALLLELLSHQNLADMKYGHDPVFKFSASRAIYKGILKFLSSWYGVPYSVQPLPVKDFSAMMTGPGKVQLSWNGTEDPLEPTAKPEGYIVYTRVDDGAFDAGIFVSGTSLEFNLESGKLYSWKVEACNEGGRSFPSETLSAGFAPSPRGKVLVVNNFTRLAAPAWFDTPYYAGFDAQLDGGVPYIKDISYCGDNYEMRRAKDWISDYAPGFGASGTELAGLIIAGNNFDYPAVHGRALMDCGWTFCSCSASAFDGDGDYDVVDLVCGKQVSTLRGNGRRPARFQVFPSKLRESLKKAADRGCCLIVSGSRIATDAWDSVYPIADTAIVADGVSFSEYQKAAREFVSDVLGYKWVSSRAGTDGMIHEKKGFGRYSLKYSFVTEANPEKYCVENCDGIKPAGNADWPLLYYSNRLPAAILHDAGGYKAASFAFPLESISDAESLRELMGSTLETLISR